ncbi:hypothetical protein H0O00_00820 [Candidatus Micrarchaeota archaeon]|nr:hypothetical protein [Candidatus Micrarchaeota archaeon]
MDSNSFSVIERKVRETVGNGMFVLNQGKMRSRFTGTIPKSLFPLVEKLRGLDPVKDNGEYQKTLNTYLKLSKSV